MAIALSLDWRWPNISPSIIHCTPSRRDLQGMATTHTSFYENYNFGKSPNGIHLTAGHFTVYNHGHVTMGKPLGRAAMMFM